MSSIPLERWSRKKEFLTDSKERNYVFFSNQHYLLMKHSSFRSAPIAKTVTLRYLKLHFDYSIESFTTIAFIIFCYLKTWMNHFLYNLYYHFQFFFFTLYFLLYSFPPSSLDFGRRCFISSSGSCFTAIRGKDIFTKYESVFLWFFKCLGRECFYLSFESISQEPRIDRLHSTILHLNK